MRAARIDWASVEVLLKKLRGQSRVLMHFMESDDFLKQKAIKRGTDPSPSPFVAAVAATVATADAISHGHRSSTILGVFHALVGISPRLTTSTTSAP